jgi:chromosome segregation ATPase
MRDSEHLILRILNRQPLRAALWTALALTTLTCASEAGAQQDDKRAKETLRRLQLQQREFNDQKAALEQDKAKLEQDKTKLEKASGDKDKELKRLRAKVKEMETQGKTMETQMGEQTTELGRVKTELAATNLKLEQEHAERERITVDYKASLETIKRAESDKKTLEGRLAEQMKIIGIQSRLAQLCEEKNLALYRVGTDLLDKYRHKGVVDALKQAEPFTQIENVRVENLWQEYKDALDREKLAKPVLAQ